MLLCDIEPGMFVRTKDLYHFRCDENHRIINDLGITVNSLGNTTEVEKVEPWDNRLWENESFEVIKYSNAPNQRAILRKQNGVRFFADIYNYQVHIVFNFKTKDPRIDYGSEQWVGVFNTLTVMKNSLFNFITYDEKIVLHCDSFTKNITIPSRRL